MPTTDPFPIANDTDDQFIQRTDNYPPTGTITRDSTGSITFVARDLSGVYVVSCGLLRFDTSSLPDTAVISAASLQLYATSKVDTNSLSLVAGWYAWNETNSDWTNSPETNAHSGTPIASLVVSATNDFSLINLSNINKTGLTYLRLHITQRASDAAPSGNNHAAFVTREHATLPEPQLLVTYTMPASGRSVGAITI